MSYYVKDSVGTIIKTFPTYKQAVTYKYTYGNLGWYILNN